MGEQVTAGPWEADGTGWVRFFEGRARHDIDSYAAIVDRAWQAFGKPSRAWIAEARGGETGQQGRDAADAALRAAGVVLL